MNNENQPEQFAFLAGAIGVLAVLVKAFPDILGAPFRAGWRWWKKPSDRELMTQAMKENTNEFKLIRGDIAGIRLELSNLNGNVRVAIHESRIATSAVRIALDESRVGRWECDERGYCVNVNRALCALFDLPKEQMLGVGWTQRIVPSMRRVVSDEFHRAYIDHESYRYAQNYAIEVKGKIVNIRAQAVDVVLNDENKIIHMFGTCELVESAA